VLRDGRGDLEDGREMAGSIGSSVLLHGLGG
jgi:hypothetical protein